MQQNTLTKSRQSQFSHWVKNPFKLKSFRHPCCSPLSIRRNHNKSHITSLKWWKQPASLATISHQCNLEMNLVAAWQSPHMCRFFQMWRTVSGGVLINLKTVTSFSLWQHRSCFFFSSSTLCSTQHVSGAYPPSSISSVKLSHSKCILIICECEVSPTTNECLSFNFNPTVTRIHLLYLSFPLTSSMIQPCPTDQLWHRHVTATHKLQNSLVPTLTNTLLTSHVHEFCKH